MLKRIVIAAMLMLFQGPLPQQPHGVLLTWTTSTSSGVIGYKVYRCFGTCTNPGTNWVLISGSTLVTGTSFLDNSIGPSAPNLNTTYSYAVVGVDASGNLSPWSNIIQQATPVTAWPTSSYVGPSGLGASNI